MKKIILASGSPRRRELLETAGIPFEVMVSDADEKTAAEKPEEIVKELSGLKCMDILGRVPKGTIVLGADTIVAMDGAVLGKPADQENARQMLRMIQGRTHDVYTGVTIAEAYASGEVRKKSFSVRTEVRVAAMTEEEISSYIATGEPMDKAGAYGIQGTFCRHVEEIKGDYFNVVGLPVHAVYEALKRWQA